MNDFVETLKAAVRPTMAIIGYVIACVVLVFAWSSGAVTIETALGVWLAPAALYGIDRTVVKHQTTKVGDANA